jgi:uncharacterized protein YfaT (DUF1175 family)
MQNEELKTIQSLCPLSSNGWIKFPGRMLFFYSSKEIFLMLFCRIILDYHRGPSQGQVCGYLI